MSAEREDPATDPWLMIADLRRQLAERTAERDATAAERDQALAREAATAEVLQVINSSPGDLAPVFDALLEKATRLCEAPFGVLWSVEDGRIRPVASHNVPDAYAEFLGRESSQPGPESAVARTIRKGSLFHFADAAAGEPYRSGDPFAVAAVKLGGVRSLINVPLVKDKAVFGIFGIYRQEVRPFSDRQVGLLQNFATQAVIAMENARLINETREALEQQTATAQVLGVINSSPGELAPVFDAMLEKAMRLCEAAFGMLWTFDGDRFHMAAHRGLSAALEEALRRSADLWSIDLSEPPGQKSRPGEGSGLQRLLDGEEV